MTFTRQRSFMLSLTVLVTLLHSNIAFESLSKQLCYGRKIKTNEILRHQTSYQRSILNENSSKLPRLFLEKNKETQNVPKTEDSNEVDMEEMEYRNVATKILSNFMNEKDSSQSSTEQGATNPIDMIDFNAPKFDKRVNLETMADILDYELYNSEWFVTGKVNPIYFANDFQFQDPDVKLNGIEEYSRGVNKLFDQTCSRAEIMKTYVNTENKENDNKSMITVQWRLSGKVKIGFGITIKPYIVYTDFIINDNGLIVFQEDRFDIPQWDILISALFPFFIGIITSNPAPPVIPRTIVKPSILS